MNFASKIRKFYSEVKSLEDEVIEESSVCSNEEDTEEAED